MSKLVFNPFTSNFDFSGSSSGSGDVTGPGSSTDNAIARFDGTTGKIIQNSGAAIDDSGNLTATNFSGSSSGTNTGDQTITLTGDVTGSGTGSFATTIANSAVTNAKMANMANNTVKANKSGGSAAPSDTALGDLTETGSAVLTITGTKTVVGNTTIQVSQSTTSTSGYLSSTDWNTFNNKQPALGFTPEDSANKAQPNGYASLDGGGKIPATQLPSSVMDFKGAWDASSNTPTLADGTGDSGDIYRVSVAGTQNLGSGSQTFGVGDWVMYNGSIWQKSPATDAVTSVNGFTGAVTLTQGNLTESTSSVLTISGGTNAVWGSGTSVQVKQSSGSQSGYLSSTDWTTFNNKQPAGNYITGLTDDVSASGPGSASATVNSVGGKTSSEISTSVTDTQAATSSNTPSTIVKRDGSGSFSAGTITASLTGTASGNLQKITGDIDPSSFSGANNQSSAANVTGLAFANGTTRAFDGLVSVYVDATSSLYEEFKLQGIQKGSSWDMSIESTGDTSQVTFTITNSGQVQYTSANYSGFNSLTMKFRAITVPV